MKIDCNIQDIYVVQSIIIKPIGCAAVSYSLDEKGTLYEPANLEAFLRPFSRYALYRDAKIDKELTKRLLIEVDITGMLEDRL